MQQVMKDCPYCAETIRGDARICKHCRSNLAGAPEGKFVQVRLRGTTRLTGVICLSLSTSTV